MWITYAEFSGSDDETDEEENLGSYDNTSAADARSGKDIQGVPWLNESREWYRHRRLERYINYENVPLSGDAADKRYKLKSKGGNYYDFFYNSRAARPTVFNFQLRNLVWAMSKHDVYLMSKYSIKHWSSLSQNLTRIINFSGHVAPTEKHEGSFMEGFTHAKISALAVNDSFLVAGGFQGELVCKSFDKEGVSFCTRTFEETAITSIQICDALGGGLHIMTANNDCGVKEYYMDGFQLVNHFPFPWPVNLSFLKWVS